MQDIFLILLKEFCVMNKQVVAGESLNKLSALLDGERVYIIIDSNLSQYYHYFDTYPLIEIETSETLKNISTVESIISSLLEMGADRDALIVGVGGGITTDIAGFVAATYKRGVKCAFVPTTLLAQVDAAIGGKNGVNVDSYKNMVGTIVQPKWVFECAEPLRTLSPREVRAGVAEVLKTFMIFDALRYRSAVDYFKGDYFADEAKLNEIIAQCAMHKCEVVSRDEFERGERRLLNLGHTFAHAIEKECVSIELMHGEAVAIGMVLAAKLSCAMGYASTDFAMKVEEDIKSVGLPHSLPVVDGKVVSIELLIEAIKKDKKVEGDKIHFIMPRDFGVVEDILLNISDLDRVKDALC
jgi:3-dehydroquinate synthase